ncbi:hypothetical protein [Pedobacter frigoris]|uniref:hypothetical protein n=1 Tax=Pedobacter frigoris TaxID=2571272 RepID=UPI0029316FC6|nr:hypothetical protein [Pedobacter frigoris]
MTDLSRKNLKSIFISSLKCEFEYKQTDLNPFTIKITGIDYFIFLKYLTPAYFKDSPDVSRIQLPSSNHYDAIMNSDTPFIVLGYDPKHDVFVNWEPGEIKERLNARKNVSLYSRTSIQSKTDDSKFAFGMLKSGGKFIAFKPNLLSTFFKHHDLLYSDQKHLNNLDEILSSPKLDKLEDPRILADIIPLLKENRILEAVNSCSEFYSKKGYELSFSEWFELVKKTYDNLH